MNRWIVILSIVLILLIFLVKKAEASNSAYNEGLPEGTPANNNLMNLPSQNTKPQTAHFNASEFDCKDGTKVPKEYYGNLQMLMENLEVLREALGGSAIHVNSGYRSPSHNKKVGGKPKSEHLVARAADITVNGYTPAQVHAKILELIGQGKMHNGGLGKYSGFTHYDVGNTARW